jgi:hypothetical protein
MATPANDSIASNTSLGYMAMSMYAGNTMEMLTTDVTWATSDSAAWMALMSWPQSSGPRRHGCLDRSDLILTRNP